MNQSAKKSLAIKSGRVCTLPGLARIKGGKGRLFGLKYRELRSDEEGSDEPSDEEVQLESHFPSLSKAPAVMSDSQMDDNTGVGLHFEYDKQGYLKVKKIAAGGPAERCGMIEVGDVVVDVSGQNINVYEDPLEALKSMILGRAGTVLEFGLQKPGSGQVKRVKLRRAERYGSDATKENDPVMPLFAAIPDSSQQVRPRVKVRTTFTKGQSEHNRTRVEGMQSVSVRPHSYTSAPGGPRLEADSITSTGSVGSDKFELSGVGVTLRIGPDDMFYVHDILSGGPAERNGCLSHGDRVIAINDLGLEGKHFLACAKMLNGSMGTVANLDLISVGDFGLSEPQVKRVTLRRTWVPDMVWNAAGDEVAPRHEDSADNVSDHSAKQAFVPHGVGITFTKTQNDSTFSVKRVTEGGPADVAGTIKSGDIIKTVDGVSVERKTYRQFARMILGPLGSIVQLGIERGPDREQHLVQLERGPAVAGSNVVSEQSSDSMSSGDGADEPPSRRSVVPQRKVPQAMPPAQPAGQVVGVGLKCDLASDGRFIVVGVQPGGPADRSGRIFFGDHLCAVGGANLGGKSKTDLRDLIMGVAGSTVLLQVVHANGSLDDVKLTRDIVGTQGTKPVPRAAASSDIMIMGNNAGVGDPGMQIQRAQGGLLQICELQTGGGAHLSQSVSVGEFISGIDGVRVVHLDDQTVFDLLCGVPGTKVNLSIQSADGQDRVVEVVRTPAKSRAAGTGRQLEEEKSFDGGSDYGDDDSDSHRGSRGRKTGLGMSFKSNHTGMIIVRRIKEGGPAERLGIREGDTIVALDGVQLQNMYSDKKELSRLMLGYAGSQVQVTLQRKGQTKIENMVLTRGRDREESESGNRVITPVAPQESWASDESFASINKVGLGLTFVKPDGQPGVLVKRVKEGGAAAASGRLFPGDRVMQIDDEDLLHMTSKVLTNLVMGPEGSVAHLKVRRVDGAYEYVTVHRGVLALDSDGASKYAELRSEPSLDFSVCGESRRERCGLGITFQPPDSSPGMVISRIKENGPAVGSGIESGDRLIAVDGISLETRSSSELSKILLGAAGTQARLEIRKAHGKIIEVEITRGTSSFGLNAENSRESVTSSVDSVAASDVSMDQGVLVGVGLTFHRPDGRGGVLVKRVKDGSAAAADGRIAPGDRLLAIDGRDLGAKISHEDLTRKVLGEMGSLVHLHVQFSSGVSEEIRLQRSRTYEHHASKTERVSNASQLCGLGLTFFPPTEGDRDVVIKRVKDGGAAQGSRKIVAGDRLLEIDGQQVHRLSGSELKSLLMGVSGSSCVVRIEHQNGTLENVKLVRTSRDETYRAGGQIVGIASEMSLDEVAFASAASRGERKRKVGLGMVLNEFDGGQGLTIRKVKRGSASDLSGKVQAGDRLLSVDGTSLDGLKRDEIEKLVMRVVGSTSVCVLRRRDNSLDHVMLLRPEPALQAGKDADEVAEEEEEGEDEPQKLVGLGMVFLRPDNKGGRVIKRLKEGSAADAHGDVVPGDRCLSIDGKPIENMTDRELSDSNRGWLGSRAVVVLRSKGGVLKTCELKRRTPVFDSIVEGCGSELSYDSSIASGLTASDTTGRCGLGLTFHEWKSVGGGLRVKRVKRGGAADNSGRIHPGDIVQAIDGTKLGNVDHRALLKIVMGPEGSIAVLNLVKASGQAMQVILTRAPRGDRVGCDEERVGSPCNDEGISPTKGSSPSSTGKSESVSRPSAPAASPKVLPTKVMSPPELPLPARSSPLSQMPKVLAASPLSSPPDTQKKTTPSSPSQMPKVLSPVPIAPLPVEKAPPLPPLAQKPAGPLPPPAQKPVGLRASEEAQQRLSVEQTNVGEMPAASDFKPLLMGMGAAFAQESLPDNGDDDDATFGEPAAEGLRDDLSEMSMDDSVLGDGDDEDGSRRQCGLGITFRKHDGQRGVVVKRVKPGGGAELCGDIAPGDRVLRLDGRPLEHLSQAELASMTIGNEGSEALLEVLKTSTKQEVMVSVTRIRSQRGLSFADKEVREYCLVSGELSRESSREDLGEEGDLEYKDGTKKIPRITRTGLGLTFKPPDGRGGLVVKRVKEDGPALHLVEEGDRIISIDDWPLDDISNQNIVRLTLGIPGTEATLRIIRAGVGEIPDVVILRPLPPAETSGGAAAATPEPTPSLAEDSSDSVGSQVGISLSVAGEVAGAAKPCGIGLSLSQESDGRGVIVKRVKEGGAAALEGSISAGDVVVSIDDTAMAGLDQTAQAKVMMGAYGSVAKLVVLKVGAQQQHTVMLPRRLTAAPSLKEDSSDSLSSISSEASTSSSVAGAAKSAGLVGMGLTFLKADKATGALPVKRVKEDSAAASSSIQPGDMVLSIDGAVLGKLDNKELTRVVMGEAGSAARLEILKRNGQRETVVLLRGGGVPSLAQDSSESLSSEVSISSSTSPAANADCEKPVGIGLTFLKPDPASGGLPVKRVKEDGGAVNSGICPGDIVVSIDGQGPIGQLDSKALNKALMGPPGSIAKVEVLKKGSGERQIVVLTRGAPSLQQWSSESIGSVASVAASDVSSTSSSSSTAPKVALGFTYRASKTDGRWCASTIKGGWAQQSGMVRSGDVIVSVAGQQCTGLDLKQVTTLLQVLKTMRPRPSLFRTTCPW
jgi:C-terminal processing protease CtpA/Prc